MFDAHCHLDLADDPVAELARGAAAGVCGWVVAGVDPAGWARQAALAAQEPRIALTYGLHPWTVAAAEDEALPALLDALADALGAEGAARPVGLGELGLDHGRRGPPQTRARQERAFRAQLALARDRNLPVVLHVVGAPGRVLEILRQDGLPASGGMVHHWSGPVQLLPAFIEMGLCISFSPAFLHRDRIADCLRHTPAPSLLLETDAPGALPDGRPVGLAFLATAIAAAAALRAEPPDTLARRCADNAADLFGLRRIGCDHADTLPHPARRLW